MPELEFLESFTLPQMMHLHCHVNIRQQNKCAGELLFSDYARCYARCYEYGPPAYFYIIIKTNLALR